MFHVSSVPESMKHQHRRPSSSEAYVDRRTICLGALLMNISRKLLHTSYRGKRCNAGDSGP